MSQLLPAIADNNQPNQSSAFAAALIKAKQVQSTPQYLTSPPIIDHIVFIQVAAKIKPGEEPSEHQSQLSAGQKRPLDSSDSDFEGPSDKRQSFGMAGQVTSEQVIDRKSTRLNSSHRT